MRYLFFFLVILASGLLQVTFLDYFRILGVKPDLLLISIVTASLSFELRWVIIFSLFAGLFKDAFNSNTLAINTLLFPLWGFLIFKLSRKISLEENLIRTVLIFIIALVDNTIAGLILVSSGNLVPLKIILRNLAAGSIYTALIFPLVERVIIKIFLRDLYA